MHHQSCTHLVVMASEAHNGTLVPEQHQTLHVQLAPPGTSDHNFPKRSSSIISQPKIDTNHLSSAADEPELKRLTTPTIVVHTEEQSRPQQNESEAHPPPLSSLRKAEPSPRPRPATTDGTNGQKADFLNLSHPIPTGSLLDLSADRVQFSNRGSLILLDSSSNKPWGRGSAGEVNGQGSPRRRGANGLNVTGRTLPNATPTKPLFGHDPSPRPLDGRTDSMIRSSRVMSADEANLSRRVRAMYETGTDDPFTEQTLLEVDEEVTDGLLAPFPSAKHTNYVRPGQPLVRSASRAQHKLPHETAGGIEDWEDVKGEEVDRYGFITAVSAESRGSRASAVPADGSSAQRISTPLLEVSNSPRKRGVLRRMPSRTSTVGTAGHEEDTPRRHASRRSVKPQGSIYSYRSNRSIAGSQSSLRSPLASKDRKLMIDAADMLTLPPGLSEFGSNGPRTTLASQQKERERESKWKKMARLRPGSKNGSGMHFDFDTSDPKLVSRTWKGIPDRWRGTAWYSFLEASARKDGTSASEAELFAEFQNLQSQDSADDVQIDMDVPRTINRHIMFRRRYRGGQRLLFRVLHALSLYFPEVGYVQGMAALAATLLCYYDEEHTFVMMVRLWKLRGLHRLFESGFEGLMEALNEFEKDWLQQGDVSRRLVSDCDLACVDFMSLFLISQQEELGIHCTAYGTRWYLTLFNYSIPFPAQLRVWDVFMLLDQNSIKSNGKADLDVLHATSAALMDATREIILDSDFENSMKVLTSWIPVKDEDLLMRVAHAEWKQRKRRADR